MDKKEFGVWLIKHGYECGKSDAYSKEDVDFVLYDDYLRIWFRENNSIRCLYADLRFNNDILYVEFAFV